MSNGRSGANVDIGSAGKPRLLLALLLSRARHPVSIDWLTDALWGDAPPPSARRNTQLYVYRLRRVLGQERIIGHRDAYSVDASDDELDALRFERLAGAGDAALAGGSPGQAVECFKTALALWRGEPYADFPECRNLVVEADRLTQLRLMVHERCAEAELQLGRAASLIPELSELASRHPLNERVGALLMLALHRSGRRAEALESFRRIRGNLVAELGLEPGAELRELHQRILEADPSLDHEMREPAPIRAWSAPGNLPAEATSFVGRHEEMATGIRLLRDSRLVTLTGVGGVGKTRLAIRLGHELAGSFPEGVWLIDLSAVRDPDLVAETVARTLGMAGRTTSSPVAELGAYLSNGRALLILDTCEHLIGSCAALAESLLREVPQLRVLATSREPLGLPGEQIFTVNPMSDDAVTLFAERAREADHGFALTDGNREAVTRLCRLLDGIPLALELAAVRMPVLSVEQLLDRIDERFAILGGSRTALTRHRALSAAIGWSHQLCSAEERLLWARLSVFPATFDLASAESVCADEHLPRPVVWKALTGLVSKSVVTRDRRLDAPRFRLLDTIREYGRGCLRELGEEERGLKRHHDHFLELTRGFENEWFGADQIGWYERMLLEHANVRAALDFGLARHEERRSALELVADLWPWWAACGLLREGRHYLERALRLNGEASPDRIRALWACGHIASGQGDLDGTRRLAAECRELGQADQVAHIYALHLEGLAAALDGRPHAGADLTGQAIARNERNGGAVTRLLVFLLPHAFALLHAGEPEAAMRVVEEHREISDGRGERWTRAWADYIGSQVSLATGKAAAAMRQATDSLEFSHRINDTVGMAGCIDVLAQALSMAGDGARVAHLLAFSDRMWRHSGYPRFGSHQLRATREHCEVRSRALIGEQAFDGIYREALDMNPEEALSYVLALCE
ncbi:ATP-binding protein [Microtetraspora niveoalba]|uniref:ATP-binding protein n=1 Tax=Microtetraspora niveoalba TaxID=46175 RepID=UPI001FE113A2|nr:BTAD domain-containing putative transcriptional regulator [Microtetraspora niveoalba]